ncbi:Gfo/Idh/MocA family protein [Elioraea thermophila]|uniref:Gfo/Idh/MocA family protein n=1 Tax=Elioraea thermophila TaxID=2185104 RepID=UPI000DF43D40|nr:Gfo/Idh/MocA family oxidoreductase [Elioraea thermophila]
MSSPVRLAVVGAGHFGRYHALKAAADPRVDLVGILDRDPAKAERLVAETGGRAFASLEEALGEAEAVIVAASTRAHYELGLRVLGARRHLLMEKPLATRLDEADALVAAAKAAEVVLQVGHLERFSAAQGLLGRFVRDPFAMEFLRHGPFRPRGTDVSVVLDLMIHDIDLALVLAAAVPVQIEAVGRAVRSPTLDVALARVTFANGRVAQFSASRLAPAVERVARLHDGEGSVVVDLVARRLLRTRNDTVESESWQEADPLAAELAAFVAAVRGEAPVVVDGEAGRAALAVALAIEEAALASAR